MPTKADKCSTATYAKEDFQADQFVVYPGHGVGRIEAIEKRTIGNNEAEFYIIQIIESKMVVMVPLPNAESVGLRKITPKAEVKSVYKTIQTQKKEKPDRNWNRRHRKYMEKIMDGELCSVAEVYRDLYCLNVEKGLSFEQRKMLDTTRKLLVSELSIVKSETENKITSEIESLF